MKATDDNIIPTSVNPANLLAELHLSVSQVSQLKFWRVSGSSLVWEEIHPIVFEMAAQPIVAGGRHPLAMYSLPSLSENQTKILVT